MANEENLKGKGFDSRSTSELREIAQKGGRASGEARRRKADLRRTLNALLTAKVDNPELTPLLEGLGLENTLESAVTAALIKNAMTGNVKAFEAIRDTIGQTTKSDLDIEEQKIKIDRDKRARDQEVGNTDNTEGIQSFLKAMRPTQEEMDTLFNEEDGVDDAKETEESSGI